MVYKTLLLGYLSSLVPVNPSLTIVGVIPLPSSVLSFDPNPYHPSTLIHVILSPSLVLSLWLLFRKLLPACLISLSYVDTGILVFCLTLVFIIWVCLMTEILDQITFC